MAIPLYGFLKGDTMGLVILGDEHESVRAVAAKLQQAASVRVPITDPISVFYKGQPVDLRLTLTQAGFEPLERFDVVPGEDE